MRMGILSFVASLYIFVGGLGFLLNMTAAVFLINKHHHTILPLAIYGLSDTLAGTVAGIGLFIDGCLYFSNLTYSSTCYRYFLTYTLLMFPLVTSNFSALGVAIERYRAIVNLERSENTYKLFSVVWTMVSWFTALAFVIVLWGHTELHLQPVTHDSTFHWEYENDYRHSRGLPEDIWSQRSQFDWASHAKKGDIVVGIVKGIVLNEVSKINKNIAENNANKEDANKFLHQVKPNYNNVIQIHPLSNNMETQTNIPEQQVTNIDENILDYYSFAPNSTKENNTHKENTSIQTEETNKGQSISISFGTEDKPISNTFHQYTISSQLHPINSSTSADTLENYDNLHTPSITNTHNGQIKIPINQKHVTLPNTSITTTVHLNNSSDTLSPTNLTSQNTFDSVLAHKDILNSTGNTNFQETKTSLNGMNINDTMKNSGKNVTYSTGIVKENESKYNSSIKYSENYDSTDQKPSQVTTPKPMITTFSTKINESKTRPPEHSIPYNELPNSSKAPTPILDSKPPNTVQNVPQPTEQNGRQKPPNHGPFFTRQSPSSIPTIPSSSKNMTGDIKSDMTKVCRAQPGFLKILMTMLFVGVFAIPLLASAGLYFCVAHVLYNHRPPNTQDSTYHQWSHTKRATVKVLSILIVYIVCWTPFMVERLLYAWRIELLLPMFVPALLFLLGHTHNLLRGVLYVFDDAQVRLTIYLLITNQPFSKMSLKSRPFTFLFNETQNCKNIYHTFVQCYKKQTVS
ncbi:uncharacterized protein LOC143027513 [Oratosquilla oratoria]|uniref:uncharacterized protein LOC143027513 n=1 Tax=Oratosquilla oratoria TaxID=337810 RepID=UPI003F774AB6